MRLQQSLGCRGFKVSSLENSWPTVLEMREFAAQFSISEWFRLCQNPTFIRQVDRDLKSAARIASLLLKKHVFIWLRG